MIVVGISGASGPIMGIRLIEELLRSKEEVMAVVSPAARQIIGHELPEAGAKYPGLSGIIKKRGRVKKTAGLTEYDNTDFFAPMASGTANFEAVVVVPCSMKTLAAIAAGFADTLITRACDVALKEKRRCVIVPRETPLNLIHVRNLYQAAQAGVEILPPVPGFYTRPETVDDVVDFIVGKILSLLERKHTLFKEWGSE
ncbi:MAG: UbiX family flavin prenyltransferase [Thermodesulfobacteriota bacterium]